MAMSLLKGDQLLIPTTPRFADWRAKIKVDGTQLLIPLSSQSGATSVEQVSELVSLISNPNGQLGVGVGQRDVGVAMLAFVFDQIGIADVPHVGLAVVAFQMGGYFVKCNR